MFTVNELIALLKAKPFVPFRLHMSDGGSVFVPTPEVVFPTRRMAVIGLLEPGQADTIADRWTTLSYMHVTRAELLNPSSMPFAAPPPNGSDVPSPTAG